MSRPRDSPAAGVSPALLPALVAMTLVASIVSALGAPLVPDVAEQLSVSVSAAQWSLTASLLAGAVAAPILGRLGDGPWRRQATVVALAIACAGGLLAGLARELPLLILGRTMQGVGFGLAPIAMAVARSHLPADRVAPTIGLLSVTGATGVGVGYPLTGLIATEFDVFAAFLFGALLCGVALALAVLVIPSSRGVAGVRLDLPGALLGSAGIIALLIGVGQGEEWGWGSTAVLAAFALAAVLLLAWVRLQLRTGSPLVELGVLRNRAVLGANGAALLAGVAFYAFLTTVTGYVQVPAGLDGSALDAGLALIPFSVLSFAASRLMWRLAPRLGARRVMVAGSLLITIAAAFFALAHGEFWEILVASGLVGLGFGFLFAAIPALLANAVPKAETGSALGFYQVIRSVGFSLGSAMVASVLTAHVLAGTGLPDAEGYVVAAWVATGFCALAAIWVALTTPSGGAALGLPDPITREDAELASAGLIDAGLEPPARRS